MSIVAAFLSLFGIAPKTTAPAPPPWLLSGVPEFGAGVYSTALYNTGTGLDHEMAFVYDTDPHPTDSFMQLVRETTAEDLAAYCSTLSQSGYTQSFRNTIENNEYYAYSKKGSSIYFYRNGNTGETRVIHDCCNTVSYSDVSSVTPYNTEDAVHPGVYQFSYPYLDEAHPDEALYAKNGMMYIILLSDKRVIVIDGGEKKQSTDRNAAELWKLLHKITGKEKNEPITVALWYGTHAHGDHTQLFYKLLCEYHKKITVERAMFNYQSVNVIKNKLINVEILRWALKKFYPDLHYLKQRSGFRFQLQDAVCEVLYTQEDAINAADASWNVTNLNDFSAVLKVTLNGKTFLFPGDSNRIVAKRLLKNYSAVTLKIDVLQAAHHVYNDLEELYAVVQPTYVMCPQSKLTALNTPLDAYVTLRKSVPEENFFFAGENIVYGLTPLADGSISVSETAVNCSGFDGIDHDDETQTPGNETGDEQSDLNVLQGS